MAEQWGLEGLVSVCVATCRRPDRLDALLSDLAAQELPAGVSLEVVVVDDDPDGAGGPVAARRRDAGLDLTYVCAPAGNVSLTRNRTVALARGSWVAFVDDDERVGPGWLAALVGAAETHGADAVFGPVVSSFEGVAPGWLRASTYYALPLPPTGERVATGGAGNVLVRRSLLPDPAFDPAYGRTGGEDTLLFERLGRAGARLIACREAVATETVGAERQTLGWLRRRAFRTGASYARRQVVLDTRPTRRRVVLGARAGAVLVYAAAGALVARDASSRLDRALRAASAAGQLSGLAGRVPVAYGLSAAGAASTAGPSGGGPRRRGTTSS